MSLIGKDPSEDFLPLRHAMDRLFEGSFVWPERFGAFAGQTFPLDLYESPDKKQYIIEASIAGFKPEEIKITVEGGALTIHAEKQEEKKEEERGYVRRERYAGTMTRTVSLPGAFDENRVEATYEHGVLTMHVPKAEGVGAKQILVKAKEAAGTR